MLEKDGEEHPIPAEFRPMLRQIVDAFAAGDYKLGAHAIDGVEPVDPDTVEIIAHNICAYGDTLVPLNDETWNTSIARWMGGYWHMLIDLSTAGESVSDLVLHADLHDAPSHRLEIISVHVP
ncbi:MAG: hypothetical protein M3Q19_10790 [Pseudomonadota bacterium]|nr:hypothetical protein [Pseudomonadota bacterium]